MSAFQALVDTAQHGPGEHSASLHSLVGELVQQPCVNHRGARVVVPESDREDVAQDVLVSLLSGASRILARLMARNPGLLEQPDRAEKVISSYASSSIANRWLDIRRREQRHEPLEVDVVAPEEGDLAGEALAAVHQAMDRLCKVSPARASTLRTSYEQLEALALGRIDMESLVQMEAKGPEDQIRARNRLYRRHGRLRHDLLRMLDDLWEEGLVDADTKRLGRMIVIGLLTRRQIKDAPPVDQAQEKS